MAWLLWCFGIESILVNYFDKVSQLPSCLSTHIIEEKHKILKTSHKSEESDNFLAGGLIWWRTRHPIFLVGFMSKLGLW